jgi:hypothetical protein
LWQLGGLTCGWVYSWLGLWVNWRSWLNSIGVIGRLGLWVNGVCRSLGIGLWCSIWVNVGLLLGQSWSIGLSCSIWVNIRLRLSINIIAVGTSWQLGGIS